MNSGGRSNASEESKRRLQGSQLCDGEDPEEIVQVEEGCGERCGHIEAKEQAQEKHWLQASKEGYVLMAKRPQVSVFSTLDRKDANVMASMYDGKVKKVQLGSNRRDRFFKVMSPLLGPFRKSGRFYK